MKEKDKIQARLQQAFNDGFIPKEIRLHMENNGHTGQVWVVEQPDSIKSEKVGEDKKGNPKFKERPVYRIGIGYKVLEEGVDEEGNTFEREASHILTYDQDEIQDILREIK